MMENPWRLEEIARMNRERVQDDMRSIRLEEQALEARFEGRRAIARTAWITQPLLNLIEWLRRMRMLQRPAMTMRTRRHARI